MNEIKCNDHRNGFGLDALDLEWRNLDGKVPILSPCLQSIVGNQILMLESLSVLQSGNPLLNLGLRQFLGEGKTHTLLRPIQ